MDFGQYAPESWVGWALLSLASAAFVGLVYHGLLLGWSVTRSLLRVLFRSRPEKTLAEKAPVGPQPGKERVHCYWCPKKAPRLWDLELEGVWFCKACRKKYPIEKPPLGRPRPEAGDFYDHILNHAFLPAVADHVVNADKLLEGLPKPCLGCGSDHVKSGDKWCPTCHGLARVRPCRNQTFHELDRLLDVQRWKCAECGLLIDDEFLVGMPGKRYDALRKDLAAMQPRVRLVCRACKKPIPEGEANTVHCDACIKEGEDDRRAATQAPPPERSALDQHIDAYLKALAEKEDAKMRNLMAQQSQMAVDSNVFEQLKKQGLGQQQATFNGISGMPIVRDNTGHLKDILMIRPETAFKISDIF